MSWANVINTNTISLVVGAIGALIGAWQTIKARRVRHMSEEKCETRCRDLVHKVKSLSSQVQIACDIVNNDVVKILKGNCELEEIAQPLTLITSKIHAIDTLKKELMRFCERLNDEHEKEFGRKIFQDLEADFDKLTKGKLGSNPLNTGP
jgi:hypothetical protein